jgi:molybdopterin/thiamine biosynthesis adenylyltransferase
MSTIVVIGAGGCIGSSLVTHLARLPGVRRVCLVDQDVYDASNLRSQNIRHRDVGRPKASVQARRLREIDPDLVVEAIMASVEAVPLGRLRCDVLLACVDSRGARRAIGALAWRIGVPWIDAGVNGEALLARINVYVPGPEQPCNMCAWDDRDYEGLEQTYPCGGGSAAAPTNAPSALGALAASLQALECSKVLARDWDQVAAGRQITVCARPHRQLITTFRRNPRCRFDHEVWRIEPLDRRTDECTVMQALELGRNAIATDDAVALKVVDQVFARRLSCLECNTTREIGPYVFGRLDRPARVCERCGGTLHVAGFDMIEWLRASDLAPSIRDASLRSFGVRDGDVLSITGGDRTLHFELGGTA